MSIEIDVAIDDQFRCQAKTPEIKNAFVTDAPADKGGLGEFLSPTDVVAAALGSCVLITLRMSAARAKIEVGELAAQVSKEMVSEPKRRIGSLKVTVHIPTWHKLSPEERKRLEGAASACPVKASLNPEIALSVALGE